MYHVYLKLSWTFFVVIDPVFGCQHHGKVGCYGEYSATILSQNEKSDNAIML